MLVQWRFKIVDSFTRYNGELICGEQQEKLRRLKPRPSGLFLYKPSRRKYDYVDYTGSVKGVEAEVSDLTTYLEMLGYIKFIDKKECDNGFFVK